MSAGLGVLAGTGIIAAQQVKQGSLAQLDGTVGFTFFVDEQRECDSGFFAEAARVSSVAQPNGGKPGSLLDELLFVLAQLRDMLPAKDSAIVAQEYHGRR